MKILKYIVLLIIIWAGLSSLSIRGHKIDPIDIYENANDIKINKYIDSINGKYFVLKCKGIKDTIGILYQHFYPANNGKPTIKSMNSWWITIFVLGKDRVSYSTNTRIKNIKYPNIYTREINNINDWIKQVDINKLISENKLSYSYEQNTYGLFLFYYLIPAK